MSVGWNHLEQDTDQFFEHSNEHSGYIKDGDDLGQSSSYEFLKRIPLHAVS
jgi:hypothetical protein